MPREAYSDQVKRDAVVMYEDHSHVSLNFLGMFQIFPSAQTEQNLGHFTMTSGLPPTCPLSGGRLLIDAFERQLNGVFDEFD